MLRSPFVRVDIGNFALSSEIRSQDVVSENCGRKISTWKRQERRDRHSAE
jgi:hypothetical protein